MAVDVVMAVLEKTVVNASFAWINQNLEALVD